ncbi:MAG: potassium channel protein [Deltaproteobacteria bacterium]|nr:MAG: potassium channel protein [Deltaproteobacteria bacterium]
MEYKRLQRALTLLFCIIAFGTCGYYVVEHMSVFEAFYMTLITISTVGFSEIKPLTIYGRIITIIIISGGVTLGAYTIGMLLRMFIEGELRRSLGRRKLEKNISALKGHFIICGYGRIGKVICRELQAENIPFVVIEKDRSKIEVLEDQGYLYIHMDATSEEALIAAGIKNARGIVPAVRSDANNVFITLTAKGLQPEIFVLSRASDEKNEAKLKRAGAQRVVSPHLIGGRRMAQVLKRPTVVDFIDIAMMESHLGLMMEEAKIGPNSDLIGKTLIESQLRQDFGVIIVAIKKPTDEMIFNPSPSERLEAGDVIVVMGKKEDLKRMTEVL